LNGALNAGILAAKILGISDEQVAEKMEQYQESLQDKVLKTVAEIKKAHPNKFDQ